MSLIIEDGTGVTGAQSYVSESDYLGWSIDRFGGSGRDFDPKACILLAMDRIESFSFKGYKVSSTQALQWPRYGVLVDGIYISGTSIPDSLKTAVYEMARIFEIGEDQMVKKERLPDLEKEYFGHRYSTGAYRALAHLVKSGPGGFEVFRG